MVSVTFYSWLNTFDFAQSTVIYILAGDQQVVQHTSALLDPVSGCSYSYIDTAYTPSLSFSFADPTVIFAYNTGSR